MCATTWMYLENIVLHERSQSKQATYCMILFMWDVQNRQIYRNRKQISDCHRIREGREQKRVSANGYRVSLGG